MNLTLLISPLQFRGLMTYLQWACDGQQAVPLHQQPLAKLVLINYLTRWTDERIAGWLSRKPDREYRLTIPLTVAKALHDEMPIAWLREHHQLFLNALDHAIVNHQSELTG